jgi:hypothetical protein
MEKTVKKTILLAALIAFTATQAFAQSQVSRYADNTYNGQLMESSGLNSPY